MNLYKTILNVKLFWLFISISTFVNAQSTNELDKRNGFKDFKLGDPYSKWKQKVQFSYSNGNESKTYSYVGECCKNVFETPVNSIFLTFYNDTLRYISLMLEPYEDGRKSNSPIEFKYPFVKYDRLITDFKALFGNSKEAVPDDKSGQYATNIWEGKNVVLLVDYYFFGNYDYSKIVLLDKIHYSKLKASGF